ncbi:MAG: bifunctional adenosylcobinamide kinase/adenosylcobinamide-phosphate guanylyltransferase [Acidimicrobiia bacterium]
MITLVLGGARSGKSAVAEGLCGPGPVVYIATAIVGDGDMARRVAAHQARRPASWSTVEAGADVAAAVRAAPSEATVLVDSLTTWVAQAADFAADVDRLCGALAGRAGDTVVVSDEVGLGVHPSTEAGRRFRDCLGEVNQAVAAAADRVLLVVAGRVLPLERP